MHCQLLLLYPSLLGGGMGDGGFQRCPCKHDMFAFSKPITPTLSQAHKSASMFDVPVAAFVIFCHLATRLSMVEFLKSDKNNTQKFRLFLLKMMLFLFGFVFCVAFSC